MTLASLVRLHIWLFWRLRLHRLHLQLLRLLLMVCLSWPLLVWSPDGLRPDPAPLPRVLLAPSLFHRYHCSPFFYGGVACIIGTYIAACVALYLV